MSVSLELTGLWLGYGDDFGTQLNFNAAVDIKPKSGLSGRTDAMADGTIRAITEPGSVHSYDVSIGLQDRTNREAIAALAGQLIELRTGRGDLLFGIFWGLDYPYLRGPGLADLAFTLDEVTYSIEV